MSHISTLKTILRNEEHLRSALSAMGCSVSASRRVKAVFGESTTVDFTACPQAGSDPIGFRKGTDGAYDVVADWYGVKGVKKNAFMNELQRQYAYVATCDTLRRQGFDVAKEEEGPDRTIRLVLRRMA